MSGGMVGFCGCGLRRDTGCRGTTIKIFRVRILCVILLLLFVVPCIYGAEKEESRAQESSRKSKKEPKQPKDTAGRNQHGLRYIWESNFVVKPDNKDKNELADLLRSHYFERYKGRTITDIEIVRLDVFDSMSHIRTEHFLNKIHYITRESRIRRDLLFKTGDKVDPHLMMNNEQLIHSRDYISAVRMEVEPIPSDTMSVKVTVYTHDSWTITADGYVRASGKTNIELIDQNIIGLGNELRIGTSFDWLHGGYGGNTAEYRMPNFRGTFFSGRIVAGKTFSDYLYGMEMNKNFITPKDYAVGTGLFFQKDDMTLIPEDSSFRIGWRSYEVWGGISRPIKILKKSNIYATGRFYNAYYYDRPQVNDTLNPYFYQSSILIANFGIYRESFTAETMIFGYGLREYLAHGYKVEFVGGFAWTEFGKAWYMGAQYSAGRMFKFGYINGYGQIGSFLGASTGKFSQSMFHVGTNYFTPLSPPARYRVRQFLSLDYMRGWNRLYGHHEVVDFNSDADIRGLSENVYGENRALINTETVVFTPWRVIGFKIAAYFFADMGFLGNDGNVFNNPFYASLGLGVRIKNERLVFKNINIRFGFALKKNGLADSQYFRLSNEENYNKLRYIPNKAQIFPYQ